MEYIPIKRTADAFQQPITSEHIQALCRRAFGESTQVESAHELGGGLYNNTYLIRTRDMQPVILRVGPHPSRMGRHEQYLLRNEYLSQPFLVPIAPLLPHTLMADFTHQLIERDYLFQTFMDGVPWSQIMNELIYRARYLGGIRLEQYRHRHQRGVERSYQEMQKVIVVLSFVKK